MLSVLLERLIKKSKLYQDEMVLFLYDKFEVVLTTSTISKALALVYWLKKATYCVAKKQNTDLQDFYLYNLSNFRLYRLAYINKSECDNRIGFRWTR